jgi:membrane fusion protein (multidrug efflux system)
LNRLFLPPQQAVSRDPKGNPVVLIVNAENKVEQRMITADRAIGDKWYVSSGLKPGDRVIVEGLQKVRPGVPVKIVSPDAGQKDNPQATNQAQPTAPKAK